MNKLDSKLDNSRVCFYRNDPFQNDDVRRSISGVAGDFGHEMPIKQIKLVQFTSESIIHMLVVGNHRHLSTSNQWEIVVVLGKDENIFLFRWRNLDGLIGEKYLSGGDVVVVPPGCSLALRALHQGASLLEISNQIYHSENYLEDILL
jgi:hypothetical protein